MAGTWVAGEGRNVPCERLSNVALDGIKAVGERVGDDDMRDRHRGQCMRSSAQRIDRIRTPQVGGEHERRNERASKRHPLQRNLHGDGRRACQRMLEQWHVPIGCANGHVAALGRCDRCGSGMEHHANHNRARRQRRVVRGDLLGVQRPHRRALRVG